MTSAVNLVTNRSLNGFIAGSLQSWLEAHWLEALCARVMSGMVSTARVSAGRSLSGGGVAARSVRVAARRKVARDTLRFIMMLWSVVFLGFSRLGAFFTEEAALGRTK